MSHRQRNLENITPFSSGQLSRTGHGAWLLPLVLNRFVLHKFQEINLPTDSPQDGKQIPVASQ